MSNPLYFIPTGMLSVTPSDTDTIDRSYNGIFLEDAGDVAVQFVDGSFHIYGGLLKHSEIWGHFLKVLATGTTATEIYLLKAGIGPSGDASV